jgi:membrane carboxypeptidase/penicillin-binding protein
MRFLPKVAGICLGVLLSLVLVCLIYIFYYSRDLPDFDALANFAPTQTTRTSDACLKDVVAVPYDSIGTNLRNALSAAEFHNRNRHLLAVVVARSMFCTPSRALQRHVAEFRAAAQLERRFSQRDLFTIYANRAYFGDDIIGVDGAAQHFYHKEPG